MAVLLVSADFLASEFIIDQEVPRLLERWEAGGLVILPLVLKPCGWEDEKWLSSMNLRPRAGRPVCSGNDSQIDTDFTEFVSELRQVIRRLGRAPVGKPAAADAPANDRAPQPPGKARVGIGTVLGSY